jgi:hypothetical protein
MPPLAALRRHKGKFSLSILFLLLLCFFIPFLCFHRLYFYLYTEVAPEFKLLQE